MQSTFASTLGDLVIGLGSGWLGKVAAADWLCRCHNPLYPPNCHTQSCLSRLDWTTCHMIEAQWQGEGRYLLTNPHFTSYSYLPSHLPSNLPPYLTCCMTTFSPGRQTLMVRNLVKSWGMVTYHLSRLLLGQQKRCKYQKHPQKWPWFANMRLPPPRLLFFGTIETLLIRDLTLAPWKSRIWSCMPLLRHPTPHSKHKPYSETTSGALLLTYLQGAFIDQDILQMGGVLAHLSLLCKSEIGLIGTSVARECASLVILLVAPLGPSGLHR